MFAIQKTIDSRFRRQPAICSLSLCLAIPALCAAAADSPMNAAVRLSGIIDPPEIPFPPPPPSLYRGNHGDGADGLM